MMRVGALLALGLAALVALHPARTIIAEVAAGYGAKLGCSIVFVSGRTLQSALDAEFVFPPIKYAVTFQVDQVGRCVTAAARLSSTTRTACWKSRRGACWSTWTLRLRM